MLLVLQFHAGHVGVNDVCADNILLVDDTAVVLCLDGAARQTCLVETISDRRSTYFLQDIF